MAFDGLLLHVLTKELNEELAGARIDRVYQPTKETLILYLRSPGENHRLLVSVAADSARLHLTKAEFSNPKQPPAFCMLMRKHLAGGRIEVIRQQGLDRVVTIEIAAFDEFGEPTTRLLQCELMGKHSNILLLNKNQRIMDSAKRFSGNVNVYREIMPGVDYIPPPPQEKLNPFELDEETFMEMLLRVGIDKQVKKALLTILAGFSPQSCAEIIARADLDGSLELDQCGQYELSRLWQALTELLRDISIGTYTPTLVKVDGRYTQFSAFDLTTFAGEKQCFASLSEALDHYYKAKRDQQQVAEIRHLLNTKIKKVVARTTKKLSINKHKLDDALQAEQLKIYGEIITANIYRMQRGMKELQAENFYTGETITIPLKHNLTAAENAQRYFKRYHKAKHGGEIAADFIKNAQEDLSYLDTVSQAINTCDTVAELTEIKRELVSSGIIEDIPSRAKNKKDIKKEQSQPRVYRSSDGIPLLVGKNNRQNDLLTLKLAKPEHTWLHVKDIPGSHVLIQSSQVPDATLAEAAVLAAYYSKAKDSSNVPVDYTLIKHVSKPKGAKPGMVIYQHQKTLFVTPDFSVIAKLDQPS